MVEEQHDRDDARGRRQQRVLERTQAEDADTRLAVVDALLAERVQVDGEAAPGDEDPEAGRHERQRPRVGEPRAALDPGDLPVGEHVADVGNGLGGERQGPHRSRQPRTRRGGRRATERRRGR